MRGEAEGVKEWCLRMTIVRIMLVYDKYEHQYQHEGGGGRGEGVVPEDGNCEDCAGLQ